MFNVFADGQSIFIPLDEELTIHSPKITLEIGKAGSFQFDIPPTNRFYNRLRKMKTIITVEYDGTEIFRGRVLTNNRGFNKVRKIYCEGDLAYLVDSVQKGEKYIGTTHDLFYRIIANHNARVEEEKQFQVGDITIDNREIYIAGTSDEIEDLETGKFDYQQIALNSMVDDWSTTLDYITNTIIDYCGGYLRTRRVGGITYLDLLKDYGRTSIQGIEFGTNLIDLTEEVKAEDVYTVLIPLGEDNLTIASVNNGSDEIIDAAGIELYGRIVKTNVFDGVTDPNTLLENGLRMITNHENLPITIVAKAVDMHLIDNSAGKILIGDRVYIHSIPHDITQYLVCTKIEYDINNHANDTYTFGNPKQTMTDRYRKDKSKQKKSSRGGGRRGAGGAASAAVEESQDFAISNSNKTANEFFKAWINVDESAGHIDLGALYEQYKNGKTVLKNSVGIDLDAPKGTINIYSDHERWLNDRELLKNNVGINLDGPAGKINIFADHQQYLDDRLTLKNKVGIDLDGPAGTINIYADHEKYLTDRLTLKRKVGIDLDAPKGTVDIYAMNKTVNSHGIAIDENTADIKLVADDLKSQIALTANWQRQNVDSIASLTIMADNNESSIQSLTSYINKNKPGIESIASITQKTNANSSSIEILTKYKNKYDKDIKGIASIKTQVDSNKSSISALSTFKTSTTSALASIKTWQTEKSSEITSLNRFKTDTTLAMNSISQIATANESAILQLNKFQKGAEKSFTEINQRADKDHAAIELNAKHIGENGKTIADINLVASKTESSVDILAKYVDKYKPNIESIASIKQVANNNKSSIEILTQYKNKYDKDIRGIASIKSQVDKHKSSISTFSTFQTDTSTAIGLIQEWQTGKSSEIESLNRFKTDSSLAWSNISQIATENQSAIEEINRFNEGTSRSLTKIVQTADKDRGTIELVAQHAEDNTTAIGKIQIIAEKNRSTIKLKADKIELDGLIERIDAIEASFDSVIAGKLKAGFTTSGRINTVDIYVSSYAQAHALYVSGSSVIRNLDVSGSFTYDGYLVATQSWTQAWVKSYVTEALKGYASSTHKHEVTPTHNHTIKIGETTYTVSGMKQGNNYVSTFTTTQPK